MLETGKQIVLTKNKLKCTLDILI